MDIRSSLPVGTLLDESYRIRRIVGSGGFGITYEAEDLRLNTRVALKEYYPADFGDRSTTLSLHPKSHRHQRTFEWDRDSFLNEARLWHASNTLASCALPVYSRPALQGGP